MPGFHCGIGNEAYPEEPPDHFEQGVQHAFERKVGLEHLVGKVQLSLAKAFRPVHDVPGLKWQFGPLAGRELAERFQLCFRRGSGPACEFLEEMHDLLLARSHARGKRQLRVLFKAEQLGEPVTQAEKLFDQRRVVPAARVRPFVGRPCEVGQVNLAPQFAIARMGHHREVGRVAQVDQPAFEAFAARQAGQHVQFRTGQAFEAQRVFDVKLPCLGGVQEILGEARAKVAEPLHDFSIFGLWPVGQVHAGEVKVTQLELHHSPLFGGER